MDNCQYPIQALAIYDPNLEAISTSSAQLFRVNKWSHQYVVNEASSGSNILVVGQTPAGNLIPVQVDNQGVVQVHYDTTPGLQKGACTNAGTTGEIDYTPTAFSILDSISMSAGETVEIYGLHSAGDVQGQVELIVDESGTITKLLVGLVTETTPNWDQSLPVPIEVVASANQNIILRIKSLRCADQTGHGTGRIFARLV